MPTRRTIRFLKNVLPTARVGALSLLAALAIGCGSSEASESSEDDGALSSPASDGPAARPIVTTAPPDSSPGDISLGLFVPKEIVVIRDVNTEADGTETPRARIIASSESNLCARLDSGLELVAGEKVVSVWMNGPAFTVGAQRVSPAADKATTGASLFDTTRLCGTGKAGESGTGSYAVRVASDTSVEGTIDIAFAGGRVAGNFKAIPCAGRTYGVAACLAR